MLKSSKDSPDRRSARTCSALKKGGVQPVLVSIVVSIPACHAGDRGSIPRRGDILSLINKNVKGLNVIQIIREFSGVSNTISIYFCSSFSQHQMHIVVHSPYVNMLH